MISTSRVLRAEDIKGYDVFNRADEKLGKIEDFVIDSERGRIIYAVLSFGGFMGMGNKLFAVPWDALQVSASEKKFVLNVDKEVLKNAPGFDKNAWPDIADRTWATSVYRHYGFRPYWENQEPVHSVSSFTYQRSTQTSRTLEEHEREYHSRPSRSL